MLVCLPFTALVIAEGVIARTRRGARMGEGGSTQLSIYLAR
jgi:hypothetical protein